MIIIWVQLVISTILGQLVISAILGQPVISAILGQLVISTISGQAGHNHHTSARKPYPPYTLNPEPASFESSIERNPISFFPGELANMEVLEIVNASPLVTVE